MSDPLRNASTDVQAERGCFELRVQPLDLALALRVVAHPSCGAITTFSGTARDHSGGRAVVRLEYEAFDAMTVPEMQRVFDECRASLGLPVLPHASRAAEVVLAALLPEQRLRMAVQHRVGLVPIGEPAVVIAVAAPHRARAFEACRFLIDTLKERVPIWKKEVYADGSAWIGERP
jgi:molybdopterin synthase catalytic subunit